MELTKHFKRSVILSIGPYLDKRIQGKFLLTRIENALKRSNSKTNVKKNENILKKCKKDLINNFY